MNEQDHDNTMVIAVPPDEESPDESGSESGNSCNLPATSVSDDTGAGTYTTESESDPFDDTSDEDNEETSISRRIEFLSEKRSLLKRAYHVMAEEEMYDAAIAIDTVRNPKVERFNSIWTEAKGVLKEMEEAAALASSTDITKTKTSGSQEGESGDCLRAKKNNPDPSDPKIDKSSVRRLISNGSSSEGIDVIRKEDSNSRDQLSYISSIPSPVFGEGQWLAQALVYAAPNSNQVGQANTLADCRWKVVSDPFTSSLGLVPPSSVSMHNAVDIQEATGFTEEPRLVTQSTPPFCVVHVNKAFLMMANLPAQDSLIGQPIESVIQVTQEDIDMSTNNNKTNTNSGDDDDDERYLESILSRGENKACRIQVVPVLHRSRCQRVTESSYTCMSHILIRVRESTTSTIHTSTPIAPIYTRPRSNSVPSRIPDHKNLRAASNHANDAPVSSLGAIG
jgi:hypothetical protein